MSNLEGIEYNEFFPLKRRYVGLDLLRAIAALSVCMFHTTVHLHADYGFLQAFSRMGAVFMTAFFMLSGYTLFVNWGGGVRLDNITYIKSFYKKRLIRIMPIYWFSCLIYILFSLLLHEETILQVLSLLPIEILGVQSAFSGTFNIGHNGGTWFVSCMVICYFVYPYLQELVKNSRVQMRIVIIITLTSVSLISPITVGINNLHSIYSNPLLRLFEFCIGIILASLKSQIDKKKISKALYNWLTIALVNTIMIAMITIAVKLSISVGNYMLYNWICLPCFMILIVSLAGINSVRLEKSRVLKWFCSISYCFFLAQLFSNNISKRIITQWNVQNNILIIAIGWLSCLLITLILRFIEKRLIKHMNRRENTHRTSFRI